MIKVAEPCPCGSNPIVDRASPYSDECRWSCHCFDCYDPTDSPGCRSETVGYGPTPEAAIESWMEAIEETWDLRWELTRTGQRFTGAVVEVWAQAKLEAERQRGWSQHDAPWFGEGIWHGPELPEVAP